MPASSLPHPRSSEYFRIVTALMIAEELRGEDKVDVYLHKLSRTIDDLLAGRTVLPWRAARLYKFFERVNQYCMQQTGSSGCRVVRL